MISIDLFLNPADPCGVSELAPRLEAGGCSGIGSFEGPHEPFLPLALAAQVTESATLYPAIAVGFARNPMTLANTGNDLQLMSRGRFALGLGTQIRPHIERRYCMQWSKPVARMRDMVRAIRAIWKCWESGETLNYNGEFYQHTLMTPIFNPGPNPHGSPPIWLAGVGPAMTRMAGEEADGFLVHPLNTRRSLEQLTLPQLHRGLAAAGRTDDELKIICQLIVATGQDPETIAKARELARGQVAFYSSTPAYRPILESEGWGDLQPRLRELSVSGKWAEMSALISDQMLDKIILCGRPEEIAERLKSERGQLLQHFALSSHILDPQPLLEVIGALR